MDGRGKLLGWEAVGRLDLPDGFCTGTLISPDIVLTAAHCVFDPETAALLTADGMVFRAGYYLGAAIATRDIDEIVVLDDYTPNRGAKATAHNISHDLALLRLDAAIVSAQASPFRIHETPIGGASVSLVSYGKGRAEALTRQTGCALTNRYHGGILGFDCSATFGSSGAPVFVREDGRFRILSVISAIGQNDGGAQQAFGMVLPKRVNALMTQLNAQRSRPPTTTGARRVRVGERRLEGARFLRPTAP